jgi:glycerophosphoryl diester phosphodiesterase
MEICESIEERKEHAEVLSCLLGIDLPKSYWRFLIEAGSAKVNGLPVLGLPLSPDLDSVWGATGFLRSARPDLAPVFLTIRFMDSRALCLDLRNATKNDAPLVEIDIESTAPPRTVHDSFGRYLEEGQRTERQIDGALRRIKWHLDHSKPYEHSSGEKPSFRIHDWRVMRCCIHDQVVGLIAIKHNEEFNGLEVDVFISTDHPDYEPGHGIRALALLLLSDAYRNGATMEIRFTRYDSTAHKRVPDRIPPLLSSLGSELGITFRNAREGIIFHDEAVDMYAAVVGFRSEVRKAVNLYQAEGRLTLQGLCYLLNTRMWTVEEASWILLNFSMPERVLFGADIPEDRLNYMESVSYGRAALAATNLCRKLEVNNQEMEGDCIVQLDGLLWRIKASRQCILDWESSGMAISITPGEVITVLPRPRSVLPDEEERIVADAKTLSSLSKDNSRKFIMYSSEFAQLERLHDIASRVRQSTGVGILILPFKCRELDEEVNRRMSRARMLGR